MKNSTSTLHVVAFLGFSCCAIHVATAADIACPKPEIGGLYQGYGPYNYITQKDKLQIVERAHFTTDVATLTSGYSGTLNSDIDYTLRAFPNHHRALESLGDLAIREKSNKLKNMHFTVPCYYIRASLFVPSDGLVNAIYAKYLSRIGQNDIAKSEIESALKKSSNNPRVIYNVGLTYYYLGDYKTAKEYSEKAKNLGSSATGLEILLHKSIPKENR